MFISGIIGSYNLNINNFFCTYTSNVAKNEQILNILKDPLFIPVLTVLNAISDIVVLIDVFEDEQSLTYVNQAGIAVFGLKDPKEGIVYSELPKVVRDTIDTVVGSKSDNIIQDSIRYKKKELTVKAIPCQNATGKLVQVILVIN